MRTTRYRGMVFDLDALSSIRHRCDSRACRTGRCCCSAYQMFVTRAELPRIAGCLPLAARYATRLGRGRPDNVFEPVEGNTYDIDTDENGLCVFAYRAADRRILCALHTVGLHLHVPPEDLKPRACCLWPVSVSTGKTPLVSVTDDVFTFPCNTRRRAPHGDLDPGIREILETVFGPKTAEHVRRALQA